MHNHCINKLLNIEEVTVKKIIHSDHYVNIFLETKPKEHSCPVCGQTTTRVHDYRMQTIKDLPFQLKHCYLVLRKRRYAYSCGKRFYEKYSFLPRYFQRTSRLTAFIAAALHDSVSVSSVAKTCNVSTATVNRILDRYLLTAPDSHVPFLLMNLKEMPADRNISVSWLIRLNTLFWISFHQGHRHNWFLILGIFPKVNVTG